VCNGRREVMDRLNAMELGGVCMDGGEANWSYGRF
jgi:hypothetical protein